MMTKPQSRSDWHSSAHSATELDTQTRKPDFYNPIWAAGALPRKLFSRFWRARLCFYSRQTQS